MKYNKNIFAILVKKIGTEQGVYSTIRRYEKKFKAYSPKVIFYFIAAKYNIKISKYGLDELSLNKVDELLERDKNLGIKIKPNQKPQIIIKKIGKENPYNFSLTKFNLNKNLTEDCTKLFKTPYRGAIREALLNLEEHIRNKLKSEKDSRALIYEAKSRGVFNRKNRSEAEGLFFLYAGTVGWLRNPPNHRRLKYHKEEAIKIILFTDYLIQLFDQLCLENKIK